MRFNKPCQTKAKLKTDYSCSACNEKFTDKKEAKRHIKSLTTYDALPRGLVLLECGTIRIITGEGKVSKEDHNRIQPYSNIFLGETGHIDVGNVLYGLQNKGAYKLTNIETFSEIEEAYKREGGKISPLIRTTPGLEKVVHI